jgi:hypothetical protein
MTPQQASGEEQRSDVAYAAKVLGGKNSTQIITSFCLREKCFLLIIISLYKKSEELQI